MTTQLALTLAPTEVASSPPPDKVQADIAALEAIVARKRVNNGRANWARAELKRLRRK